jgi:signal transduction histidine kinase
MAARDGPVEAAGPGGPVGPVGPGPSPARRPGGGLLDALVEALPVGVLLRDADRRVLLVNSTFIRLVGISVRPDELVGVVFDGSAGYVRDLLGPASDAGPADAGTEVRTAAGRVVERACQPISVDGTLLGELWVLRDVTDEAEARRGVAEQHRLIAELALLRSDFGATVSHELRTPLTSIIGLSTLLLERAADLDPEQAACLQAIDRNADRLLRLSDDLTLLAGLESRTLPLRDEPVDPVALARDRAADWRRLADEAGVSLRLDCPDAGPPLRGDGPILARMLDHLVGTAVRVAPPGSTVEVSVRPGPADWVIEVTDPTPARSPLDAHPLTASFAKPGPTAQASRHAAGLGPAISRAIAARHHGTISINPTPTGGSTIHLRIPLPGATTPV